MNNKSVNWPKVARKSVNLFRAIPGILASHVTGESKQRARGERARQRVRQLRSKR